MELLHHTIARLRADFVSRGKAELFDRLGPVLLRGGSLRGEDAAAIAGLLGIKESALRMAHTRLLRDIGEALREEVRQTVAEENEIPGEISHLRTLFAK